MSDRAHYDVGEIKARLLMLELLSIDGVEARRAGVNWVACCPFHAERSPSFTVHANKPQRGHCYGCGWDGDVVDYYQERHGVDYATALERLAALASVGGVFRRSKSDASQVPQMTAETDKRREKPRLPRMRALTGEEISKLASLRGLRPAGVAAAAADRRVGWCEWPQYEGRSGGWRVLDSAAGAWVVTDRERWVAQFRRMDGGLYTTKDGAQIKAWTKGSPAWPLGAAEIGDRGAVLLVEGGADMLAAYHFLEGFRRLDRVAVVAVLGSSNRLAVDALEYFDRKRVRIMMDEDEPKDERGIRPGCEAAARWTEQLTAAGAAVETFSLAGLVKRDGSKVKDLNDLAAVDEAAWITDDLRAAFFDFDF